MSYGHDQSFAERAIAVAVAAKNTDPDAGAALPYGNRACGQERRFMAMFQQKVFIERRVVVEIVTAGAGAGCKIKIGVARAFFGDFDMAVKAVVRGERHAHGSGFCGFMFLVTSDALSGVEQRDAVSVARVGEFAFRVRVVNSFQLGPLAGQTRFLRDAHERSVTNLTGALALVMAGSRRSRKEHGLILAYNPHAEVSADR